MLRNIFSGYLSRTPVNRKTRSAGFCVIVSATLFFFAAFFASSALAQGTGNPAQTNLTAVGTTAALGQADLPTIIGRIINVILGTLGIILLCIFLYAGYLYLTAGGSADQTKTARDWMKNAVIGLIIIVSAYAITQYILGLFANEMGGGGGGGGTTTPGTFPDGAGSLGSGIIESHYPMRGATDVPRNAAIIITFKRPMRISSFAAGYNDGGTPEDRSDDTVSEALNTDSVRIYRTANGDSGALAGDRVRVRFTNDRRTFVFRPVDYMGSATENTDYTIVLRPDTILLENGRPAFTGSFASGYRWSFEVGTTIDTTPPKVISVFPANTDIVARNAVVQIMFNEPVDPTAATGRVRNGSGFTNIRIVPAGASAPADGDYSVSNGYRTVEFVPGPPACGTNTCGEEMFCLPASVSLDATIRSATLDGTGPAASFAAAGYDGVVDVAGNSLDGNGDGTASGPEGDNYAWRFTTTNDINLDPPRIEATLPTSDRADETGRSNADANEPVRVRFNSIIQGSTFNTDNARIESHEPPASADTFWWATGQDYLTDTNMPVSSPTDIPAKSYGYIAHRMFSSETRYDPFLSSSIRNVYQNCFSPVSMQPPGGGGSGCVGSPNCCLNRPSAVDCTFE